MQTSGASSLTKPVDNWGVPPIYIKLAERFEHIVARNPTLRIEQAATGEVVLMSPTGGESGYRNSKVIAQLVLWADSFGGYVFDSSTLFELPNGAKRSPDAAWVSQSRSQSLTKEQRKGFPPLCPDFVIELRSESDRLVDLQDKMQEYVDNGIRLGWLIDPLLKQVHIYRPGYVVSIEVMPDSLTASDALPGFSLSCKALWVEV